MESGPKPPVPATLTVGHSNHPLEALLALLRRYGVQTVVDVRSSPYSQYTVHFNRETLRDRLEEDGIAYRFAGDRLGGRPERRAFYDEQGYVLYDRLAASAVFQEGITWLLGEARSSRVLLLCSEEDPSPCHRRLLIGRVLGERGVTVRHIRGDGRLQSERELAEEERFRKTGGQLNLFETEETPASRTT